VKTGVDRDATPRPAGAQAGAAAAPPAAGASPGPPSRRPRFLRRTLQRAIDRGWFAESRLLEFYPPFLWMRIRVMEIADGWRRVRIRLPLNAVSRNPGGVMFGGFQASLADPIPALACARVFPGYSVWTRAMTIEFEHGGSTDLELRFELSPEQEAAIRDELERHGRATPAFEYGYFLTDGTRCTRILNTVAIRPRGYSKATTPPAPQQGLQ
jgi:acyl-coenzyme A thioesterase PaaI-like protein